MFQTCQSLDYNESFGGKTNYLPENNNFTNNNATKFMTIKTEYTNDFKNFEEKEYFNNTTDKTANYYQEDFEEYYSDEELEQDIDNTRLTNKASLREIEDVVDIYKNQLDENKTAKKGGFNHILEGFIVNKKFI